VKKINFFVVVMFFFCVAGEGPLQAAQLEWTDQASSAAAWNGFGDDFQPNWQIQTTVVKTTPAIRVALNATDGSYTSSSSTMCLAGAMCNYLLGTWQEERWTVNRTSASTLATTSANASYSVAGRRRSASEGDSRGNASNNWAELAHGAQVVTAEGILLSNASALAYQNAHLDLRSFTADGRVSAAGMLRNGRAAAKSIASANSCFDVTYALEKKTAFSFSLDLAKCDDTDLDFSIVDARSGELLWNLTPEQTGTSYHYGASGLLDAGQYKFSLVAKADSSIDKYRLQDPGGAGMYDVSLDFAAENYWVTMGSPVLAQPITTGAWVRGGSAPILSIGSSVNNEQVLAGSFLVVPEPATITLLLSLGAVLLLLRIMKRG
jgi:hypothetical protein